MKAWVVSVVSDLVVVGHDEEIADMDNPRGEILRERYYIRAENPQGFRRTWGPMFANASAAERAYLFVAPPVGVWDEIEPCYGSEAYARNWREIEGNRLHWEREADISAQFAKCY